MKKKSIFGSLCFISASLAAASTLAQDVPFSVSSSFGVLALQGREYVYNGTGSPNHLSYLEWNSTAPVFSIGLDAELPASWTISANGQIAMSGDSKMDDYDWIAPFRPNFNFNNWTDHSWHDNTTLNWYFNGDAALGYNFVDEDNVTLNVNAGFKYLSAQWAARDGRFIYSTAAFRDTRGRMRGASITYTQNIPVLFVGVDSSLESNAWSFDIGAKAGATISGHAQDIHWKRNLRFEDSLFISPMLSANARVGYAVGEQVDFFLEGTLDKVFLARADNDMYNNRTNALLVTTPDSTGGSLFAATVSTGLMGHF